MDRAAFAAIIRDGKVLLVRSLTSTMYTDHWSLPGGIVEGNESFEEGAVRESVEETGVICEIDNLIAEVDNIEENVQVCIFKAGYVSGEIVMEDGEIADARWFSLEDGLQLALAYNIKDVLLELKGRSK